MIFRFTRNSFITIKLKSAAIFFVVCLSAVACIFSAAKITTTGADKIEDGIKIPIIMYHSILKDTSRSGRYTITPYQLEEDLQYLKKNGYTTVFFQDIIDYVYNDKSLPEKPIVLTFDDGHYNNETYLLPMLEKYNQRAVISIVGSYTDFFSETPDENPNYAYLSWKNAKELISSGKIEIENHSYDMHSLERRKGTHKMWGESDEEYKVAFCNDVEKMQTLCYENLGIVPKVFTYPFGSISHESLDYLKEMGFLAALSCNEGINFVTKNPDSLYMMKRCIRTSSRAVWEILK